MRKLFSILAALSLSIGLWAETENGYEYVDLGMKDSEGNSIMWATMNIGAANESTLASWYGDYFAWGETTGYASGHNFSEGNYTYSEDPTTLPSTADAASVNWGGAWRIPTKAEVEWLKDGNNCTWEWQTNYNGVSGLNGYLVTSKKDGYTSNSIFLPAAGYYVGTGLNYGGSRGCYWSSSLTGYNSYFAFYLNCSNSVEILDRYRYYGVSIRPVFTQPAPTVPVIRFNSCGGSAVDSLEVTAIPATLPTPTYPCTAETFGGWYFDMDYTQPATQGTEITQDTILYAKWNYGGSTLRYGIFLGGSRLATGTHPMGLGSYTLVEDGLGNATLTLDGATINQQLIAFAENLTIVMKGENSVTTNSYEYPYNEGAIAALYGADLIIEGDGQITMQKTGYGSLNNHAIDVRGYEGNTNHSVAPGCLTINSGKFIIRGYEFPIFMGASQGFQNVYTHIGYTGDESTLIINGGVFDIDANGSFCAVECIGGVATFNGGVFKAQAYDSYGRIAEAFMANKNPEYGGDPKTVLNNAAHMLVFGGDNEATSTAITVTGEQMPTTRFLQITDQSVLDAKITNCAFSQINPLTPTECIPPEGSTFSQDAEFGIVDIDDYKLPEHIYFKKYNRTTKQTTDTTLQEKTDYTYDSISGDIVIKKHILNQQIAEGTCLVVVADGVPFPYVIKESKVEIKKENNGTYYWSKYKDATHTNVSYRSTNQYQANTSAVSTFIFNPAEGVGVYGVEFDYQVSSEANDKMYMYVNGEVISDINGISGTVSGHQLIICTDTTQIKAEYIKDGGNDGNDDCGYIYNLKADQYDTTLCTLTVNSQNGKVTGLAPRGLYFINATVNLTAVPNAYYDFVQWEDGNGNVLSTDNTYSFTITQDTTIKPIYQAEQRTYEIATGVTAQLGTLSKDYPWIKTTTKPGLAYMSSNKDQHDTKSCDTLIITPADGVSYRLTFDYAVSSESGWDEMSVSANGTVIADNISGETSGSYDSGETLLTEPDTIILSYAKDGSWGEGDDRGYIYNIVVTTDAPTPAVYTRDVTNGNWGTICLPWESIALEGGDFYDVIGTKHAEYGVALTPVEAPNQLEAGKPYVFKATSNQIKVTYDPSTAVDNEVDAGNHIIGSFAGCTVPNGMYIIYQNLLYITGGTNTIGTYRAYFDVDAMGAFNPDTAPAKVAFMGGRQAPTSLVESEIGEKNVARKVLRNGQFVILCEDKTYNAQGILLNAELNRCAE